MKTKLTMQMPEMLEARDVEITGVAILPEDEYQNVLASGQLPDRYRERLNRYTGTVTPPGSCTISDYKALLVMSEGGEHGVAVCGKDYVSYASVFPNARELLESRVKKMTDLTCSLKDLPDGNLRVVPLEMLGDYAKTTVTSDNGIGELLLKELQDRDAISNITMYQYDFEIDYRPGIAQGHADPGQAPLTIAGLMKAGLEDFHLTHTDEEHDLATIVELYPDTLTGQGREDWPDEEEPSGMIMQ